MAEKRKRISSLSKFTRNFNLLTKGIDDASPESLVTPQFEKMKDCWLELEEAHDDFIAATDIEDIENDPEGLKYMDTPFANYQEALKKYSNFLKVAKQLEKVHTNEKTEQDLKVNTIDH